MRGHVDLDPSGALAAEVRDAVAPDSAIVAAPRTRAMAPTTACMNVSRVIAGEGGVACYGWMALLWPDRFVELVFHALWQGEAGAQDVTTAPHSGCGTRTTLIPEPRFVVPADTRLIAVPPSFMPLAARQRASAAESFAWLPNKTPKPLIRKPWTCNQLCHVLGHL